MFILSFVQWCSRVQERRMADWQTLCALEILGPCGTSFPKRIWLLHQMWPYPAQSFKHGVVRNKLLVQQSQKLLANPWSALVVVIGLTLNNYCFMQVKSISRILMSQMTTAKLYVPMTKNEKQLEQFGCSPKKFIYKIV